ncbi:hypothetical protein FWG95_01700 [Candidatus Saccharibacteria bacterium]|nr:hypothetical protein [Candidatus Saccharibacteria bacterium]
MNPNDPEQPSLLKPTNDNGPAAAFTSGMPDPFARQSAEVESIKQATNSQTADQPNATAASTLAGYDKSKENIVSVANPNGTTDNVSNVPPAITQPDNIYRIDSPADGNGQQTVLNPAPSSLYSTLPSDTSETAPANPSPAPAANSAADYLNQIAPQKSGGSKFFSGKVIIIGGVLAFASLATIIAVAVTSNISQAPQQAAIAVGTELTNLQTLINYGKNNIKTSSTVRSIAETNLITLSRRNDLGRIFTLADEKNPPGTPGFIAKLDSAKASSNIESVYAETLKAQLDATYTALNDLDQQVTITSQKDALTKAKNDIKELYRRLAE